MLFRLQREIERFVIVGEGYIFLYLAEKLSQQEKEVTAISKNKDELEYLSNNFDLKVILAEFKTYDFFSSIIIDKAYLITCTLRNEINLLLCSMAKKMGCSNTFCLVEGSSYLTDTEMIQKNILNCSYVINISAITTHEIMLRLGLPIKIRINNFSLFLLKIVDPAVKGKIDELIKKGEIEILFCRTNNENIRFFSSNRKENVNSLGEGSSIFFVNLSKSLKPLLKTLDYNRSIYFIGKSENFIIDSIQKYYSDYRIITPVFEDGYNTKTLPDGKIIQADLLDINIWDEDFLDLGYQAGKEKIFVIFLDQESQTYYLADYASWKGVMDYLLIIRDFRCYDFFKDQFNKNRVAAVPIIVWNVLNKYFSCKDIYNPWYPDKVSKINFTISRKDSYIGLDLYQFKKWLINKNSELKEDDFTITFADTIKHRRTDRKLRPQNKLCIFCRKNRLTLIKNILF